ncbi:hypothetical protein DV737_g1515, partial [Chaetothyriales sp. CBS 132003]
MPSGAPTPTLTPDDLEDLIYFARTGDLSSLKELITQLCASHDCTASALLSVAVDVDADGLGSQCALLHYPAANGNVEVVTYLVELVKNAPQQINRKNVSGNTPLHWAGMNGHLSVVQALVAAGADPGLRNAAGRDAAVEAEMSAKDGSKECAQWMLKNCASLEHGLEGEVRESEEDGQTLADDGQTLAGDGQTLAGDGQTLADDDQTLAGDGQILADNGQILADDAGEDEQGTNGDGRPKQDSLANGV